MIKKLCQGFNCAKLTFILGLNKNSRIQEKLNYLAYADSSTDAKWLTSFDRFKISISIRVGPPPPFGKCPKGSSFFLRITSLKDIVLKAMKYFMKLSTNIRLVMTIWAIIFSFVLW